MPIRTKMILMNAATFIGLLYAALRGVPLTVVVLCGISLFALINLLLFFKVRRGGATAAPETASGKGQEL